MQTFYKNCLEGLTMNIGVIDTGVNLLHKDLADKNINCFVLTEGQRVRLKGNSDLIGHGTAVCGILAAMNPQAQITVYKAFTNTDEVSEDEFISIMEYIRDNEEFDLLNLSLGISASQEISKLIAICEQIQYKGTLIIAAFNNYNSATYPAAFPNVIGVDWDIECKKNRDFIICENSMVNVYAKGINQKLCWSPNTDYIVNAGASFAAAHVTAFLASSHDNISKLDYNAAMAIIKKNAIKIISSKKNESRVFPCLNRVAIFPFNKEIASITNYSDLLCCDISGVYNIKQLGNVGESTIKYSHRKKYSGNYVIQNIEDISSHANSFETLVVGHLSEINRLVHKDYTRYCIDFCLKNKKAMLSFDTIPEFELQQFKERDIICYNMNLNNHSFDICEKLRIIGKPIITVIGTSSKQGKFSLQLELRRKFIEEGYKVGQWSSEPQGFLFGINQVFPLGYGSNLNYKEKEIIHLINNQLYQIETLDCDIIISGTQSHTISEKLYNARMYPSLQNAVLAALQPDALILVVNAYDADEYILRTINYAQAVANSKVICLALSFKKVQSSWSPLELNEGLLTQEEIIYYAERIMSLTNVPCFGIDEIDKIVSCLINYLEE